MTTPAIKTLFASDIARPIEEVIKVDQTDAQIIKHEIDEYVVTDAIRGHYDRVLEHYRETQTKPTDGIAIWVSGFFGSGKSSFAKMLGLAIANQDIAGEPAATRFARRLDDAKLRVLLSTINQHLPTHAVIFDVSTDRGIRTGNQTLTQIMYGLFLRSLGYARDLDLSELEIALEADGRLGVFEDTFARVIGHPWPQRKGLVAFALSEASRVMHHLEPATYPVADSWVKAVKDKSDITPGKLAERASELMQRRRPGQNLMFVVDEVGQFVARDVQKMLDLQAIVQQLGIRGRGKHWLVVTSQEKLNELVSGLDDKKIELARLMERFSSQVHLEPSDISEVTSRRVLTKNADAEKELGRLYDEHRARLAECTHLVADVILPPLTRQSFVDLYPLVPYQIDLIIQIVSGLRLQGGASKHVGGANRTIIKLAQQLLINQGVALAEQPVGALVRLDHVYDLVEGNLNSDLRAKIATIPRDAHHRLAQPVAKVICLFQYVQSVRRTAENIAAALYPTVGADSQLADVKAALLELTSTHKVRLADDGYRIPTPAEDDWERQRNAIDPKPGDEHRLTAEVIAGFWQPQPVATLAETKAFKAGLTIHNREVMAGDLSCVIQLAPEDQFTALADELRARSRIESKHVFWAVPVTTKIGHELREVFRSREMVAKRERDAKGDDTKLLHEERQRQRRHADELRRLLKAACLCGQVYFQGLDRSPADKTAEVTKAAADVLASVLPTVFSRYAEAAARPADVKKGVDALFSADNLAGLPPVFDALGLLTTEKGKRVFRTEAGLLAEVRERIDQKASYGDTASGKHLADTLASEPFGWDFDLVRLLTLTLVRAGLVEATAKGQTFDVLTDDDARRALDKNPNFNQATFRPKKGIEFEELVKAADAFAEVFGKEAREINASAIALEVRREVARHEETVAQAHQLVTQHRLPGRALLEQALGQMRSIGRGSEDGALASWNASYRQLGDAIRRAGELTGKLGEPQLHDLDRARRALTTAWPFLRDEADLPPAAIDSAAALADLLERESFYNHLAEIDQRTASIEREYQRRFDEAAAARQVAYAAAVAALPEVPGWRKLDIEVRERLLGPLERLAEAPAAGVSIGQLRSERDAADGRLRAAVGEVRRRLEGERLATVTIAGYVGAGLETIEELDAALAGIRDECLRLIGAGKKVVLG